MMNRDAPCAATLTTAPHSVASDNTSVANGSDTLTTEASAAGQTWTNCMHARPTGDDRHGGGNRPGASRSTAERPETTMKFV